MKINRVSYPKTHEGARAMRLSPEKELRRSVLSCFLWEREFYENGLNIADRIKNLVKKVDPATVSQLAVEARHSMYLRHAPLLLVRELARHPKVKERSYLVRDTTTAVIKRPDDMTELLAMYWKDGKTPLSSGIKKGLAEAFSSFDRYQLAKYSGKADKRRAVTVRDVMFLTHPKPKDSEQAKTFRLLAEKRLSPPDTWEVALSTGKDKKESFERLLREKKMGGLAVLRNLRNMVHAGVDIGLIKHELETNPFRYVLPFRFIAAAQYIPQLEPWLEEAMMRTIKQLPELPGKTIILVDVSGSMTSPLSQRSDMTRMDAACGLAMIAREKCEDVRVFSFSNDTIEVPARHGFALRDAIINSQWHSGTELGGAVKAVSENPHDRLIVITDEQSRDRVGQPNGLGYMINVGSYQHGVGYGTWKHIDGFSENIFRWMKEIETLEGE